MMDLISLQEALAMPDVGQEMHRLAAELFPICRSITGQGVRQTLKILGRSLPIAVHEIPSGISILDWTVPKEWNIRDAYVTGPRGDKVIDFQRSNLHVVSYSMPVRARMPLKELKEHLFSLPDHPDWIPYRTSYYRESWGFCISHRQLLALEDGEYEVVIDSTLEPGSMTIGEYFIPGKTMDEVLISCHICHPSLVNDNLSGMSLALFLARYLAQLPLRYSYRFLFIPGTIGSIAWLALNEAQAAHIKHGLVVTLVGDPGKLTYKKSRQGEAEIDRAVQIVLQHAGQDYQVVDFSPYGYDERQYCSPGFNLAVGCLTRTPFGQFPEYHTSADNLDFVRPEYLADSLSKYLSVIDVLEHNRRYLNQNPKGEPQLGRRGLYDTIGGRSHEKVNQMALLWVLNLSDGEHALLDIAERSGLAFPVIRAAADVLAEKGLLRAA